MNGIWYSAVIDHNANVDREVVRDADGNVARRWAQGGTIKHSGRWYTTKVRVAPSTAWHLEFKKTMLEQAHAWSTGEERQPEGVQQTFVVSASDAVVEAEVAAVVEGLLLKLEVSEPVSGARALEVVEAGRGAVEETQAELIGMQDPAVIEAEVRMVLTRLVQHVVAAAPKQSEAHKHIACVAAEATAAARLRAKKLGPAERLCEPRQELSEESAKKLKVLGLKSALEDRGLETSGKKVELLARLQTAITEAEEEHLEDGDECDLNAASEAAADSSTGGAAFTDPTIAAEAAGIALQWYLIHCPVCNTQLNTRLPQSFTQLYCSHCSVTFVALNAHLDRLPTAPLWKPKAFRKRSQMQMAMRAFVCEAMPRARRDYQDLSQGQRLKFVMKEQWPAHKATLVITAPIPPPVAAEPGSRVIIAAEPFDPASGAVASSRVQVLGLQASSLDPLPPPAFMPLAQMQRRKRHVPGQKSMCSGRSPEQQQKHPRHVIPSHTPPASPPSRPVPAAAQHRKECPPSERWQPADSSPNKQRRLSTITQRLNDAECGCNIEATLSGFEDCRASIADLTAQIHADDSHFAVYTERDVRQACLELSQRGRQLDLRGREWLSYTLIGDIVCLHEHGDARRETARVMLEL